MLFPQDLEQQLRGAEAATRAWEERSSGADVRAAALREGVAELWQRVGCQALGLEGLLGSDGVPSDANLMQYLGIIEQRVNEILQVCARF